MCWVRGEQATLGRVPIAGGEVTEIPRFSDGQWAMSPDGSRVAYVLKDASEAKSNLAILRMDSPSPEMILESSPAFLLKWRPDGQALLVRERDLGDNPYGTIVEYDLATRSRRTYLSTAPEYVLDISFSHDGKRASLVRGNPGDGKAGCASAPATMPRHSSPAVRRRSPRAAAGRRCG